MKSIESITAEVRSHAADYPEDALRLLDEYVDERRRAADSLVTVAEVDGRDLRASEARAVEKVSDEIAALTRFRSTVEKQAVAAREAEVAEINERADRAAARRTPPVLTGARTSNPTRDTAMRNIESRAVRVPDTVRHRLASIVDAAARDIDGAAVVETVAMTADPTYVEAFRKLVALGETRAPLMWTDAERQAFARVQDHHQRAALQSGTTTGSYAIPAFLDPALVLTGTGAINPLREVATVRQIGTNIYRAVSSSQVSASYDSELAEVSDDTPTFAQPEAKLFRGSAFITTSMEFAMDYQGDWLAEMTQLFADARGVLEASKVAYNGNGTSEPAGFHVSLTDTTNSRVTSTTTAALTLDDAFALQNALPARYSAGARWFASLPVINKLRALCMAQTGAGVWQDMAQGAPALFLGRPIHEISTLPTTFTSGDYSLTYADPSRFHIADHVQSGVEFVPHLFGTTNGRPLGQRGWFYVFRTGSVQTDTNSGRVLKIK